MIEKPLLIRGHRLRDEFSCPITRELMRDPVIAADGHTYDREAIEMWLRSHRTSPKTGILMDHLFLVPNHNLKRLIKDLLNEGGEGLYVNEEGEDSGPNAPYRYALVPEHVLILKCLGPNESDWNSKTFRVTERGCIGGRRMPPELGGADFMHFSDVTVSRKHFEIIFDRSINRFKIKDEGSAGGTFIRILYGESKPLYPGLMIMLGKHQLLVTEPSNPDQRRDTNNQRVAARKHSDGEAAMEVESHSEGHNQNDNNLEGEAPGTPVQRSVDEDDKDEVDSNIAEADGPNANLNNEINHMAMDDLQRAADDDSVSDAASSRVGIDMKNDFNTDLLEKEDWTFSGAFESDLKLARGYRSLSLRCFAPEGTPIQGNEYPLTRESSTLGRKQSNTIAFSHLVAGQLMGIDSSISGEHARIEFCAYHDCFLVLDGTAAKPSTNGTWFRLSAMHTKSEPYTLHKDIEILIGTVRFSATYEKMVVEKELHGPEDVARYTS